MVRRMLVFAATVMWAGVLIAQEAQKSPETGVIDSLRAEVAALRQVVARPPLAEIPGALKQENLKRDSVAQQLRRDLDAMTKASNSAVKFSGVVFAYYNYTTNGVDGNDFSKIEVDRVYLTAKANLTENTRLQFTSDVFRQTDATKNAFYAGLIMRVKFAYVEYAPWNDLAFRIGMIPTHWQGYVDGIWKYRVLTANITDNTRAGYTASADLGFSATYTLPSKLGEINANIFNGSGYTAAEANRFKDFAIRASLYPIADEPLTLGAYYYKGSNESKIKEALAKDRWGALAGYVFKGISVNLEYNEKHDGGKPTNAALEDTTQGGQAISFFGEIKSPLEGFLGKLSILWRLDYIDGNTTVSRDISRFWIVGLACKLNDKLTLIANRQTLETEPALALTRADGAKIYYDNKWYLHVLLNF